MDTNEEYIQAFNNGYMLTKHEPTLLQAISESLRPVNNYLEGFFAGKEYHELENNRSHLSDLQQLRSRFPNRGKEFEKEE